MFKMDFSVSVYAVNSRKSDAVKGVVFAHGVYCHVAENKPVAYGKGLVKGIVADDISGQTGSGSETIGVRLFACLSAAYDVGAIWQAADASIMAWLTPPLSNTSSTSDISQPALRAAASPGSIYT